MSFLSQSPKRGQMPFEVVSPETGETLTVDPVFSDNSPGISGTFQGQKTDAFIGFSSNHVRLDGNRPRNRPKNGYVRNLAFLEETMAGHTWQDVTASRSEGVVYQNTTGRPILVNIYAEAGGDFRVPFAVSMDGANWIFQGALPENNRGQITTRVPTDGYYRLEQPNVSYELFLDGTWSEFKP